MNKQKEMDVICESIRQTFNQPRTLQMKIRLQSLIFELQQSLLEQDIILTKAIFDSFKGFKSSLSNNTYRLYVSVSEFSFLFQNKVHILKLSDLVSFNKKFVTRSLSEKKDAIDKVMSIHTYPMLHLIEQELEKTNDLLDINILKKYANNELEGMEHLICFNPDAENKFLPLFSEEIFAIILNKESIKKRLKEKPEAKNRLVLILYSVFFTIVDISGVLVFENTLALAKNSNNNLFSLDIGTAQYTNNLVSIWKNFFTMVNNQLPDSSTELLIKCSLEIIVNKYQQIQNSSRTRKEILQLRRRFK